jgi:putative Mn2+ efflux pump MntP
MSKRTQFTLVGVVVFILSCIGMTLTDHFYFLVQYLFTALAGVLVIYCAQTFELK